MIKKLLKLGILIILGNSVTKNEDLYNSNRNLQYLSNSDKKKLNCFNKKC